MDIVEPTGKNYQCHIILNIHVLNYIASKYMKGNLTGFSGKIDNSIIISNF